MLWLLILVAATVAVFAAPLAPAIVEWKRRRDADPLPIDPTDRGAITHFAEGFKAHVARELATGGGAGGLARVAAGEPFVPSAAEGQARASGRVVVGDGTLTLPARFVFDREVYGRGDVTCLEGTRARALLADGELVLHRGAGVARWAHATSVRAGEDCVLLGRLSAEREVVLGPGCEFARVNAPTVAVCPQLAPAPPAPAVEAAAEHAPAAVVVAPSADGVVPGRLLARGDVEIAEGQLFQGDIVARGDVSIGAGARVLGSIKSHGAVRLGAGAAVKGAVIAVRELAIAAACTVGGAVVCQGDVDVAGGTVIGAPDAPATLTAPVIRVAPGVTVHGTLWARVRGTVAPG
jgi:hypothetical protein